LTWRSHYSIKDDGHIIRSAVSENTILSANFAVMCYRTGVIADGSFTLRGQGFSTLFAPVTLTLIRWPSYTNLTRIPSRYTGGP